MIWVLEWDSGIGDFSLIIQLTNSEEGKGVRIFFFFFFRILFLYFNAFVAYILPYSLLFDPISGIKKY